MTLKFNKLEFDIIFFSCLLSLVKIESAKVIHFFILQNVSDREFFVLKYPYHLYRIYFVILPRLVLNITNDFV